MEGHILRAQTRERGLDAIYWRKEAGLESNNGSYENRRYRNALTQLHFPFHQIHNFSPLMSDRPRGRYAKLPTRMCTTAQV
jgi:hypothetical protein